VTAEEPGVGSVALKPEATEILSCHCKPRSSATSLCFNFPCLLVGTLNQTPSNHGDTILYTAASDHSHRALRRCPAFLPSAMPADSRYTTTVSCISKPHERSPLIQMPVCDPLSDEQTRNTFQGALVVSRDVHPQGLYYPRIIYTRSETYIPGTVNHPWRRRYLHLLLIDAAARE
jgi:hypothetical protein